MKAPGLRVALRADASSTIGLGHVRRCLSLAGALRTAGAQVCLVTRDLGVPTDAWARAAGVEHLTLPEPSSRPPAADIVAHAESGGVDWRSDAQACADTLHLWRPDWVVVDSYALDARWHRLVGERLAARIAVIDDLADRQLQATVLIDHNLSDSHVEKYLGRRPAQCTLLGGPRYALLGPAYPGSQPFVVAPEVRSIGIFMGGADAAGLTAIALHACREHAGFTGPIEIVTTRANPNLRRLRELVQEWPATTLSEDLPDLAAFFRRHDLQIGAGGGASWERCCTGVPTLVLRAADNQEAVVAELARRGAVAALDPQEAITVATVGEAVRSLLGPSGLAVRRRLSERSQALVDGLGAMRVALRLAAQTLAVRPATPQDSQTMHRWRNHPAIRATSHDSREIAWGDHADWLRRSLADPRRCLLIGHVGQLDVGVIRFDAAADDQATVSLYVDPAMHGLGLGRQLLLAGEAHWQRRYAGRQFVASVLESNAHSRRMFESCGYHLQQGLWRKDATGPVEEGT